MIVCDTDAEMLQKARKQAPKSTLLFRIPAPVVMDEHGIAKGISAKYSLAGDKLTVTATGTDCLISAPMRPTCTLSKASTNILVRG